MLPGPEPPGNRGCQPGLIASAAIPHLGVALVAGVISLFLGRHLVVEGQVADGIHILLGAKKWLI